MPEVASNGYTDVAEEYRSYNLSVVPCLTNKHPGVNSCPLKWSQYQNTLPSKSQIKAWFDSKPPNIGFLPGLASEKVEVIDIDCKYDLTGALAKDFFKALKEALPEIFTKFVIEETENKGYHIFYRCPELEYTKELKDKLNWGNTGLAHRPTTEEEKIAEPKEKKKVLIETRGHGGFIVTAPSPGYKIVSNSKFDLIPKITLAQRNQIFEIARSFDQCKEEKQSGGSWLPTDHNNDFEWEGETPWEAFDRTHGHDEVLTLLQKHGYKKVKKQSDPAATVIVRPGITTHEHSGYVYEDTGAVKMFSSSTEFEAEKSYFPSMVYTVLEHAGDRSEAFKQLHHDGYGHRQPSKTTNPSSKATKIPFIKNHITENYNIRHNEMTNDYELDNKPIGDRELNTIYVHICESYQQKYKKDIAKSMILDTIESDFTPSFNPLMEHIQKNQNRNCSGAIKELAACIETPTEFPEEYRNKYNTTFTEYFITKWIVNMIATATSGTDNPLLLALLGKQNTGKTEFYRRLFPDELKRFYTELAIADDKDFHIAMTKNIMVMDDELSGKSRVEMQAFKKIMSKQNINLREPYGRKAVRLIRRASLAGTGNELKILYDLTGNRRIIPIEVAGIDHDMYNSIDKIDVIVDAWNLLNDGFNYRLSGSDIEALNASTEGFEFTELEIEICQEYLKKGDEERHETFTAAGIKNLFETHTKPRVNLVKLGRALSALNFPKKKVRLHGKVTQVYRVHPDSKIIELMNQNDEAAARKSY